MTDEIRPSVTMTPTVYVEMRRDQPDAPMRLHPDDGTVRAFMAWQSEAQVFPLGGTASVGPGFFVGLFDADDAPKIAAWFKQRGVHIVGLRHPGGPA